MQDYWLVVRVLLTPPAAAAASQKWKIIYLQVLRHGYVVSYILGPILVAGVINGLNTVHILLPQPHL